MKLQAELSGVQKRLNYVANRIVAYERLLKNIKSMMKLCVIGAIISIILMFLSPIIQNASVTGGAFGMMIAVILVFMGATFFHEKLNITKMIGMIICIIGIILVNIG